MTGTPDNAPTRVLTKTGRIARGSTAPPVAVATELLAAMRALRAVDQRMVALLAAGRVPAWRPIAGEEAVVAGLALGLAAGDWLLPGPRWPGPTVHDEACGSALRTVTSASPGAARAVHAVGIAWAARMKGSSEVAAALLAEGAVGAADFHAAMNFAAVRRAPCLLVVTGGERWTDLRGSAQDAGDAWGMRSATVDGGDALAVLSAVSAAATAARAGEGPTLLHAVLGLRDDPTTLLTAWLRFAGALDDAADERLDDAAAAAAEAAERRALAQPSDRPADLLDHVLAAPHPSLEAQRRDLPRA